MASRIVFIPSPFDKTIVKVVRLSFKWQPGFAVVQKQKNIRLLHEEAKKLGLAALLEISTKSPDQLGRELSAFNLKLKTPAGVIPVENAYQSSKVFDNDISYEDLLFVLPRDAKRDERLRNSGKLRKFDFFGSNWELVPSTAFYDWLYISALHQKFNEDNQLLHFNGFTDIEFNPSRSVNCQARSAAMYVSLKKLGLLEDAIREKDRFLSFYPDSETWSPSQPLLGF